MLKDVYEARPGCPVQGDPSQPVYVVEVGAGHGRFAFLVLQALLDLQAFLPKIGRCGVATRGQGSCVCVCMCVCVCVSEVGVGLGCRAGGGEVSGMPRYLHAHLVRRET